MKNFYKNKRVLITGAAGTVGGEVFRQLLDYGPSELRLVDNNETGIFSLMEEYRSPEIKCFLGDVRDREKMDKLSYGADIVIHCAAFKHVILSEYNPFDVVQTNIIGIENIIRAAIRSGVKNLLFTSSDKAVNPTNVMGTSKLMGEKLVTAANISMNNGTRTVLSSTRFGNVLGSRGSVVPLFTEQIKKGGPVTITDNRMTRFIMTIGEAAALVLKSAAMSMSGEVFVTKMPVIRIRDLAEVMIEILAPVFKYGPSEIEITETGAKPGEKLYEELMSEDEARRSIELSDMFVIKPAFSGIYPAIKYTYPNVLENVMPASSYISANEPAMSKEDLKTYLLEKKVLGKTELTEENASFNIRR